MRFAVIAYAVLAVAYAENDSNTTCCSVISVEMYDSSGVQTQQQTQYMDQERYPFQPYRPIIPNSAPPEHVVEAVNTTSLTLSATPSITADAVEHDAYDTNVSVDRTKFDQNMTKYQTPSAARHAVEPVFTDYMSSFVPHNASVLSSPSLTSVPQNASDTSFSWTANKHGTSYGGFVQYGNQYKEKNRDPYQTYKPFIPTPPETLSKIQNEPNCCFGQVVKSQIKDVQTQGAGQYNSPFQSYKPFVPLKQDVKNYSRPAFVASSFGYSAQNQGFMQYQAQYKAQNRNPYEPYKPSIPTPDQIFEVEATDSFGRNKVNQGSISAYGQSLAQRQTQYFKNLPYEPYKPNIPSPLKSVEPVSFEPPASFIKPSVSAADKFTYTSPASVPPPSAPAINISIESNGRSIFDSATGRNDTLPLFKILVNNVYNHNTL